MIKVLVKEISNLPDPLIDRDSMACLDKERRDRIGQIRNEADRKRSLAAGILLDKMTQDCGIKSPEYGKDENGKPYLVNVNNFCFNLSHSGDYVVIAYASGEKIGIDVQKKKTIRVGVEKKILSEKESEYIQSICHKGKKEDYLFSCWSVKESYAKWDGRGIVVDFTNLDTDFCKSEICHRTAKEIVAFREINIHSDYKCFVCGTEIEEIKVEYV